MIADCLKAADIGTVVWIDDYFKIPSAEDYREWIDKQLAAARVTATNLAGIPFLDTVDWTRPSAEIDDALEAVFETLQPAQFRELAEVVGARLGTAYSKPAVSVDLPPSDFEALCIAFGPALKTFSLADWRTHGQAAHGTADEKTLFLVDKSFEREDHFLVPLQRDADHQPAVT